MLEWCVAIVATLLALLVYFAYFFKFNWVKVSDDQVFLLENCFKIIIRYFLKDLRRKSERTRQIGSSKNRKVGKLPPVYPNGWFALLESSQIEKGQVKHVSALGENFAVFRYIRVQNFEF